MSELSEVFVPHFFLTQVPTHIFQYLIRILLPADRLHAPRHGEAQPDRHYEREAHLRNRSPDPLTLALRAPPGPHPTEGTT